LLPTTLTSTINWYNKLNQEFRTKELGLLRYCLGIEFNQDPSTKSISMSQKQYAQDLLLNFGMSEIKNEGNFFRIKTRSVKK